MHMFLSGTKGLTKFFTVHDNMYQLLWSHIAPSSTSVHTDELHAICTHSCAICMVTVRFSHRSCTSC
jgi:hypothetical protein